MNGIFYSRTFAFIRGDNEFMRRLFSIFTAIVLAISLCGESSAQQAPAPLTKIEFSIVGVTMSVGPEYQAVPKGIASQVTTGFVSNGEPISPEISAMLPQDWRVTGELTGPTIPTPLTLTTTPGLPFQLPTFPLLGKYTLANIRVLDGTGKAIMAATPQSVTIESISDPLITSVTTRQLTLQEIQDRGVVVDSSNFTVYEFTGAVGLESNRQEIKFPVLIPNTSTLPNPEDIPPPSGIGLPTSAEMELPPQLPANISLVGFEMTVDDASRQSTGRISLPPIPGIIVIPNNIGFLHQYFSALLMVTNGAPGLSDLTVKDLQATIILPPGDDYSPAEDQDIPGDDPLRMAKGANGYFPFIQAIMNPGPDGKIGTADDVSLLHPAETGQADFTIEGLKEGTHPINFEIKATLEGLPIGPVAIKGKATGAVLVRNPDFSITMGHPATVRTGEAYDLFVTVTNTSKTSANLVSTHLDKYALSGAVFAPGENADKQIETILPGSSATVKYHLISQRTGKATATAFASKDVAGRFILRMGVGELGIPLSPDTLILPYTGSLPTGIVEAAVGLLGQAWSVATAPTGALPPDVPPIGKQTVTLRANDLSEAGLRILYGEQPVKAVEDLAFDFLGSDNAVAGFDSLRRRSTQGLNLNAAIASVFRTEAQSVGALTFQSGFAEFMTYRPGHITVITSESSVRAQVSDASNNKTGGLSAGEAFREIPYSDQFILSAAEGTENTERSTLSLITKIESASYRVDLRADADASFDLGIVVPGASMLRQARFSGVSLPAGGRAWVTLLPGTDADYVLNIDGNADGTADETVSPSVLVIPDPGPRVVAATQMTPADGPGGDKHGRNVAVLFSERVTKETAQNLANYAVEENAVKIAYLQRTGRMAFLMLRDGIGPFFERHLTVSGLTDPLGNGMDAPETRQIAITAPGPAAVVSGTVRTAQGVSIPSATVRLMQLIRYDGSPVYAIFSEKPVNADGSYRFEYVFQNDDPVGPFLIEAMNNETGETGQITAGVIYHGQQMVLDVFMKARGAVTGTVKDASGNPVPNAAVQLNPLNDVRSYTATTDAMGGFSFSNVRVGPFRLKAVSVALYAEGQTMGTLPEDGGGAVQDVTIFRAADVARGDITGSVLDLGGAPRSGAIVTVYSPSYANWTRTAADGSYSFIGAYAGPVNIVARDDATGEQSSVSGSLAEGGTAVFNIILRGTGALACKVEREDGLSPQGFSVVASVNNAMRTAYTGADGTAVFDSMPVGDIAVRLPDPRNPSYNLAQGSVSLQSPGDTANITLVIPFKSLATGKITGTVRNRAGAVRPDAEVRLVLDPQGSKYKAYFTDKDGRFVIPNPDPAKNDILPLGTYYLIVKNGAEIANGQATLWYDGQTATVDLDPVPLGTVKGTIYDNAGVNPDGTPHIVPAGADVLLYAKKPNPLGWLEFNSYPLTPAAAVKSDPQYGTYQFNGVYGGPVAVYAFNIFKPTPVSATGALRSNDETLTFDLRLIDTFGSISGNVLLPDGTTPAGEGVEVTVNYGGADVIVTTDPAGHFQFRPVI